MVDLLVVSEPREIAGQPYLAMQAEIPQP